MVSQKFAKLKSKKRSAGVIAAVMVVTCGMAFALLQSQDKLTGNSIETESANMVVSQNDSNYGQTTSGYHFTGIIPGTQASQTEHFFLKNVGTAPLALKLSSASTPANPSSVDLSKVKIILTPFDTTTFMPGTPQSFSFQSLVDAGSVGVSINYPAALAANSKEEFNIQVAIDDGAVGSAGASLSNIDLAFTGTAIPSGS